MTAPTAGTAGTASVGEAERLRVQRRTMRVVVAGQVLGGAGLAAGVTVGALLAQQMLGSDGLAGLPVALFTLGSALAAYVVGRTSQRLGRRVGLAAGFLAGGAGAAGIVVAAALDSVVLLLPALLVYGAGTATNLQARYAGTDLASPAERGRAISTALVATTVGAVAGPNLVGPLGRLAVGLGLPALAGPFLLAAVAYSAAGVVLLALLRPDPLLLARRLDTAPAPTAAGAPVSPGTRPGTRPGIRPDTRPGAHVGATVMVLTQVTMVAIMTMTPVHMREHGHDLADVGLVISLHIAAMYLPSPLTGRLVDRWGRTPVAVLAGAVLLASGVTAALAPGDSLVLTTLALVLLGLGWNLGLIAGTALVVDATEPATRPRVQGSIDVLVALAGATGGVLSGLVVGASSFATLSLGGGLLALALLPALRRATPRRA
ncbi:MFS transporter [Nocardioides kribbensis]|uniref:MFS transporter n=1 Tax=Nocardioides kribbensis TaxID=305517 RepID=UPI0029D41272|nr:MFS transporter [Nocardioides kribbensis]